MKIEAAKRVKDLPPYLFAGIDAMKAEVRERGVDVIDFGIGDPDIPTPTHIIEALCQAAHNPAHHRYPSYSGMLACRRACADFYQQRFNVTLDPQKQVVTLIGSKEGIAHFPLAFMNAGDLALVPDPAYPVYATTNNFVGGEVYRYRLRADREFLPDLDAIPAQVAQRAKVMYINYPNNPTGGVATLEDYARINDYAKKYDLVILSDLAYSEMYFDEQARPPSFLEIPGAQERCLEFYSLSKTYCMTGWRVGFAVGNPELVGALLKIKTNVDSGVFEAVQAAGIAALSGSQKCVEEMRAVYRQRRNLMTEALRQMGLKFSLPKATFYIFAQTPGGQSSMDFTRRLLQEAGVVTTPGVGFGQNGEGYIRFALSVGEERIREAARRLTSLKI